MNDQHPSGTVAQARTVSRRTVATGLAWAAPVAVAIAAAPAQAASPIPCDQAGAWTDFFSDAGISFTSSTGAWSLPVANIDPGTSLTTTLILTFTDGTSVTAPPLTLGPAGSDGTPTEGSVDLPLDGDTHALRNLEEMTIVEESAYSGALPSFYTFDASSCSIDVDSQSGGRQ
ncbi:hypothetical protein [Micrococcus sp.]|uniref:hypothetical protein n=1 Tax=Micrococcus sp. TaxID=1271 RepID=UPI002A914C6D|nr:hypothetical protein [Micrococcus sp.]MDY6055353.1 hypothetical protein [Micrococcus sp.]